MSFNPWNLFFSNKRVVNRINNYARMRANLHVRFIINGNGFYYGRLMADYNPLDNYDYTSSVNTFETSNIVQASQRMKVFIDPSCPCPQQMDLPFVWFEDSISPITGQWDSLGQIFVRQVNPLKHANGGTSPLEITVYAWATEVELACPTANNSSELVEQAGDEYEDAGPVSSVASAVASTAGQLAKISAIRPYARATQMAANAVSRVASLAGWSRPANLANMVEQKPTFVTRLAPADAADYSAKLTVDSKQELTVDPRIIGVDLPDELQISELASRESYLTTFPWPVSAGPDTALFSARVSPMLCREVSGVYYVPAAAFAAIPFKYWRGDMRVRMQIVASAHHRGRLRIVYDPYAATSVVESNIQYNTIVDISNDSDFTFTLGWAQGRHFLECSTLSEGADDFSSLATFTTSSGKANGVFSVYVVNTLATPNSLVNNDISVNVFVSFEDFEVAYPISIPYVSSVSALAEQAGEEFDTDDVNDPGTGESGADVAIGKESVVPESALVYFGERIFSLRQLLKRATLVESFKFETLGTTSQTVIQASIPDYPPSPGYDSAAVTYTSTGAPFNYVHQCMLNYIRPAFVAVRGSVRSKYHVASSGPVDRMSVDRSTVVDRGYSSFLLPAATATPSVFARGNLARVPMVSGGVTTNPKFQPYLEVEHPFQINTRFATARCEGSIEEAYSPYLGKHLLELVTSTTASAMLVDRYSSVGEDFALFWFQGSPPLTLLPNPLAL